MAISFGRAGHYSIFSNEFSSKLRKQIYRFETEASARPAGPTPRAGRRGPRSTAAVLPDALQLRVGKRNSNFQKALFSKETNLSGEKGCPFGTGTAATQHECEPNGGECFYN